MELELEVNPGSRVSHEVFGIGTVIDVSNTSSGLAAYIQFDSAVSYRGGTARTHRTVLVKYLGSTPIEPVKPSVGPFDVI